RALDQNRHWREAFLVANDFAEMAKVLVRRNKEMFQPILDDLLLIACCACSGLFAEERAPKTRADREGELVALKRRLDDLCGRAVATFYDDRACRFKSTNSPDTILAEWATNEALARHFDTRLRYLLQHDRPSVKE